MTETAPETGTGRFSAYDKRLTRYVGGVHGSADEARQAAKDKGVKASDIRVDEV